MNIEKLNEALKVWQAPPVLDYDNYHNSKGLMSNSFISSFIKCEYSAVINGALKPAEEFNEAYAIGHLTEALLFEGEEGGLKMIERYKDFASTPVTEEAKKLYKRRLIAWEWNKLTEEERILYKVNGRRPSIQQEAGYKKLIEQYGPEKPEKPKPTPKAWVNTSKELASRVIKQKRIMDILRADGGVYHQIIGFKLFGLPWRSEIDFLNINKRMEIDLKTTADCFYNDRKFNEEFRSYINTFIDNWNYHKQRAVYQYAIKTEFGETLTPHILAVSKKTKSVRFFKFDDQARLDYELKKLSPVCDRIKTVLAGEELPTKCQVCKECVDSEEVTEVILTSKFCAPSPVGSL